jgi:MinD superfamily P-loop ATPase
LKEIVIISGKGGTGKTSITSSFAALAQNSVFADCDVDAADLHLILSPDVKETHDFISGHIAVVDQDKCTGCGKCQELCRFDAVKKAGDKFEIEESLCEGCGVCVHFCPVAAIDFPDRNCGKWFKSETRHGPMVHAKLGIGAENSGKLVSLVRKEAREISEKRGSEYLIVDGPPGIGCPVIASLTGSNAVVVVTEPTISGKHDYDRVSKLAKHFGISLFIVVNKWDINPKMAQEIEDLAVKDGATALGRVSYDKKVTSAQISGISIVESGSSEAGEEIKEIWTKLTELVR